jgi:TetR/AcrR family transcriptional regulator, repressor for uid operon
MPKLADQTRADRRTRILDAAKQCFVRHGFHSASMQQICAAAQMSAGNLYRYFPSKDALIAGLCARDMDEAAAGFASVRQSADILASLEALMEQHLCTRQQADYALWAETTAEGSRNASVAALGLRVHEFIRETLEDIVRQGVSAGGLRADCEPKRIAMFLVAFFDGMVVQLQRVPGYDPRPDIAHTMRLLRADLLAPKTKRLDPKSHRRRKQPSRIGVSRK